MMKWWGNGWWWWYLSIIVVLLWLLVLISTIIYYYHYWWWWWWRRLKAVLCWWNPWGRQPGCPKKAVFWFWIWTPAARAFYSRNSHWISLNIMVSFTISVEFNHSVRPKNLGANGPPNGMPFFEYHWISLISLIASMVSQFFLLIAIKNLFLLTPDTKQHREVGSTSPICRVSQPRGQSTAWSCSAALISMIYALGHWGGWGGAGGKPTGLWKPFKWRFFFNPRGKGWF